MNTAVQMFSSLTGSTGPAVNKAARYYPEPRSNMGNALIPWCAYMNQWWSNRVASANSQVATAYPATNSFDQEMFLLKNQMNSQTKQTWFTGNAITCEGKIGDYITNANWQSALACMKMHIVTWKYYYDTDVVQVLARQANRVEGQL